MRNLKLLFLLIVMVGCASPERTALNTIGSVGATADAAIGAYDEYTKGKDIPVSQLIEVRNAVKTYTASLALAKVAVTSYKSGAIDKPALDKSIDALAASSAEVINVINAATHK